MEASKLIIFMRIASSALSNQPLSFLRRLCCHLAFKPPVPSTPLAEHPAASAAHRRRLRRLRTDVWNVGVCYVQCLGRPPLRCPPSNQIPSVTLGRPLQTNSARHARRRCLSPGGLGRPPRCCMDPLFSCLHFSVSNEHSFSSTSDKD